MSLKLKQGRVDYRRMTKFKDTKFLGFCGFLQNLENDGVTSDFILNSN